MTAVGAIVALNTVFGHLAPRHFLPNQKMTRALQSSADCVLLLGDSRMDAGHSPDAFRSAAVPTGAGSCATNLAIGATDIRAAYLTAGRFFALGGRTPLTVVGISADSVLDPSAPIDPKDMAGNNAVHLIWSAPSDVFLEYPGFPFGSIGVADAGFRFLLTRAVALGQYQSLVWLSVQRMQNRLTGIEEAPRNGFGLVGDMNGLERDFRQRAQKRLGSASGERASLAWFDRLCDLLRARGVPLAAVELPMPSDFRREVSDSESGRAYRAWLAEQLAARDVTYIDLSHPDWLNDSLFGDALHLNASGAARFSHDLAGRLRDLAAGRPPRPPATRP